MSEKEYILFCSLAPGIGPKRFALLLKTFGSAQHVYEAGETALQHVLGSAVSDQFVTFRKTCNMSAYLRKLAEKKVEFITQPDSNYPSLLKAIANPPIVLYVKGSLGALQVLEKRSIAIVGSRKITPYGQEVTSEFTKELVANGYSIVSGLAYGVDAVAHQTAVTHGGITVAVLGCGVDCCYPRENQKIYESILENGGVVVSEYQLSLRPSVGSFPARNRIIAGLSQGVLVTQGATDSGALYTAEEAQKLERPVFAVPGLVTSDLSGGPFKLLKNGAILATSVPDILAMFGIEPGASSMSKKEKRGETPLEQAVLDALATEPKYFDNLVLLLQKNAAEVSVLLSTMELKGLIVFSEGMFRVR